MQRRILAATAMGGALLGACTTADLEAISAGLAEASYDMQYTSYGPVAAPVYSPYTPYTFQTYGGWPAGASYGTWVGYGQCQYIGSFYQCDTDGDGYVDMYGDSEDGSYASSHLRVNGRGQAFTWGSDCACWERNRAYDGPRQDTDHHHGYHD